ncbi:MAG TPA: tetratricopeptide repeat protein [Candidatus Sulfomarinibacteraceae bacterium]|nr:tetratricopeptide repeat protein [Candidatus Sulfomarinibacteraceae bacterium]
MSGNVARYEEALQRGYACNEAGEWEKAFKMFRVALSEDPKSAEAYAGLGEACFGLKRLDRALESYKLAARYSRGDILYLERVADLQERLGQLSEAAKTYMAAGELQLRQRHLEEAILNWERAVRLEPGLLGAHRRLAMVFQRQQNVKGAIRHYLAIARSLQMNGEPDKALQMCHAALRLDPGNGDVLLAMKLVQQGEDAVREPEPEPEPQKPVASPLSEEERERAEMTETVRQIATVFEEERKHWQLSQQQPDDGQDPLHQALRRAQDELAEEIFREEEGEEDLYGIGPNGLSKLERDALIGQGIDFQTRGETDQAIECYEKAIRGGLRLPAAFFTLGVLYLDQNQARHARAAFARAGKDHSYRPAIKQAMARKKV